MTLPTEYNESIELFKKTFDVPKLCYEILSLIKHPAKEGKLYERIKKFERNSGNRR